MPVKIKPSVIRAASLAALLVFAGVAIAGCAASGFYGGADVGRLSGR